MGELVLATAGVSDIDGLEDVTAEDLGIPRIIIDHDDGVFEDPMAGTKHETITCIILGQVKQRVLWPPQQKEDSMPLCKSNDAKVAIPDNKKFPWEASPWEAPDDDDPVQLSCGECPLKDWGTHPVNSEQPWCVEQYTFPLLMQTAGGLSPAFFTVQRTGLTTAGKYVQGFVRDRMPMYAVFTELSVDHKSRGRNHYGVPNFTRGGETDHDWWAQLSAQGKSMREYLHNARMTTAGEDAPPPSKLTSVAEAAAEVEAAPAEEVEVAEPEPVKPKAAPKAATAAQAKPTAAKAGTKKKDDVPF